MSEDETPQGCVRIVVPLELDPGWDGPREEWLWAEPLGGDRFRLESTPFFAYGASRGDVVRAEGGGSQLRLVASERKGGHRTLRIALDGEVALDDAQARALLDGVLALGCSYEALPPKIAALDVPPEVDVALVVERLEAQRELGVLIWEWADPVPS